MPLSDHIAKLRERLAGQRMKPSFLVVGGLHCGGRALYDALCAHPRVRGVKDPEPHFFDRPANFGRGLDWYAERFPFAATKKARSGWAVTGEATPTYLAHPMAAQRLSKLYPQMKLIVLLRDPVDRAWAHYRANRAAGDEPRSFEESIDGEPEAMAAERARLTKDPTAESEEYPARAYLSAGLYAEQLERWFTFMPRVRYLILKLEAFRADPARTMNLVGEHLELGPSGPPVSAVPPPPEPGLDPEIRERLAAFFAPHNERLAELTKLRLEW